jgi:acyl carrier protein
MSKLSREEVEQNVRRIICAELGLNSVTDEEHLVEDLGADELDLFEIMLGVEELFMIDIPDGTVIRPLTARGYVDYIMERVS